MSAARARRQRAHGDAGVTMVLFALALVAMLFVVALVLDFSNVRNSRQDNKLNTDLAAAAGLQALAPDGVAKPWRGVCAALDYVRVNHPDLSFTVSYKNGNGVAVAGTPCASLQGQECIAPTPPATTSTVATRASWAWITAVSTAKTFDIRSGYETPDANFPEDVGAYSGDNGATDQGGCDQLAVIVSKSDGALFGGVADRSGYSTTSRSVGRAKIGHDGQGSPAFLMLERTNCAVLWEQVGAQTNPPSRGLRVLPASASEPGIIHVDSSGTGSGCNKTGPCNKDNYAVSSSDSSFPKIVAEPASGGASGIVAIRALDPTVGGAAACQIPPAFGVSPLPTPGRLVSRKPVDDKYNTTPATIASMHAVAYDDANRTVAPAGFVTIASCSLGPLLDLTSTRVFVNCPTFSPTGTVEFAAATEVIFNGKVAIGGGSALLLPSAQRVVIGGPSNDNALSVANNGRFGLNSGPFGTDVLSTAAACDLRNGPGASPPGVWSRTATLVIFGGTDSGGKSALSVSGTAAMCQTSVYLAGPKTQSTYQRRAITDGSYDPTCSVALPCALGSATDGATFVVAGNGAFVRWTAPNQLSQQPSPGAVGLEDLALWTESSSGTLVGSNGQMLANGVFFLPNSDVSVSAPSVPSPRDAQFIARTLGLTQGYFQMQPTPGNTVQVPVLESVGLVR